MQKPSGAPQPVERGGDVTRRAFLRSCWVPPALWAATVLYLRPYDGWGAWAAAPLLLPSLIMSAVWGVFGVILWVKQPFGTGGSMSRSWWPRS
jgi:hypothetical protein